MGRKLFIKAESKILVGFQVVYSMTINLTHETQPADFRKTSAVDALDSYGYGVEIKNEKKR